MKILKFYAKWCGPCKMMEPIVDWVAARYGLELEEIDIDAQEEMAQKHKIMSIPTVMLIDDNGNEIKRVSGFMNKDQLMEKLGAAEIQQEEEG